MLDRRGRVRNVHGDERDERRSVAPNDRPRANAGRSIRADPEAEREHPAGAGRNGNPIEIGPAQDNGQRARIHGIGDDDAVHERGRCELRIDPRERGGVGIDIGGQPIQKNLEPVDERVARHERDAERDAIDGIGAGRVSNSDGVLPRDQPVDRAIFRGREAIRGEERGASAASHVPGDALVSSLHGTQHRVVYRRRPAGAELRA